VCVFLKERKDMKRYEEISVRMEQKGDAAHGVLQCIAVPDRVM